MLSLLSKLSPPFRALAPANFRALPSAASPLTALLVLLGIPFGLSLCACGPKIGDPCENSYECSPQGRDRHCDASFMYKDKGECTIWGCASGGCPDEATCVTVFDTTFATQRCDPRSTGERCGIDQVCLPDGVCAHARQGRSSCRLTCLSEEDCREGYRCVEAGTKGLYVSPDPDDFIWEGVGASVCVPAPRQ